MADPKLAWLAQLTSLRKELVRLQDDHAGHYGVATEHDRAAFLSYKKVTLSGVDLSMAGCIDEPIRPFMATLNRADGLVTTSSCSGRVCVYAYYDGMGGKGGRASARGTVAFMSHDRLTDVSAAVAAIQTGVDAALADGATAVFFKFEPFVMHVQCVDMPAAHRMLQLAMQCGYRESGVFPANGRVAVAVRCSIRLEAPVARRGQWLVTPAYLNELVDIANTRFDANLARIVRLEAAVVASLEGQCLPTLADLQAGSAVASSSSSSSSSERLPAAPTLEQQAAAAAAKRGGERKKNKAGHAVAGGMSKKKAGYGETSSSSSSTLTNAAAGTELGAAAGPAKPKMTARERRRVAAGGGGAAKSGQGCVALCGARASASLKIMCRDRGWLDVSRKVAPVDGQLTLQREAAAGEAAATALLADLAREHGCGEKGGKAPGVVIGVPLTVSGAAQLKNALTVLLNDETVPPNPTVAAGFSAELRDILTRVVVCESMATMAKDSELDPSQKKKKKPAAADESDDSSAPSGRGGAASLRRPAPQAPQHKVAAAVSSLLRRRLGGSGAASESESERLILDCLPCRWEWVGDVPCVPSGSMGGAGGASRGENSVAAAGEAASISISAAVSRWLLGKDDCQQGTAGDETKKPLDTTSTTTTTTTTAATASFALLDSLKGQLKPSEVWAAAASALGASRVALLNEIEEWLEGEQMMRRSRVRLLVGDSGVVVARENGIEYHFDMTKTMFSSGNITEKIRMAGLGRYAEGSTIVDLYAGIGYYTVPLLVHARCGHVHACELNPDALKSLKCNLAANGVTPDRYTIHAGDNRSAATAAGTKGVADRVLLGLLPSSTNGWPVAAEALKPEGGWLHLHENISDAEAFDAVAVGRICAAIQTLMAQRRAGDLASPSHRWHVRLSHAERVKRYAPRVRHMVYDLHVTQKAFPPPSPPPHGSPELVDVSVLAAGGAGSSGVRGEGAREEEDDRNRRAGGGGTVGYDPKDAAECEKARSTITEATQRRPGAVACMPMPSNAVFHSTISPLRLPVVFKACHEIVSPVVSERWSSPDYIRSNCGGAPRQPPPAGGGSEGGGGGGGGGSRPVTVHVSTCSSLNFVRKNFSYKVMTVDDLMDGIMEGGEQQGGGGQQEEVTAGEEKKAGEEKNVEKKKKEFFYLRAVGADPRREIAHFATDFPSLSADLPLAGPALPLLPATAAPATGTGGGSSYFSSVLRIGSPGLSLWTHFDVMDNCLIQVAGRKRVVLFPPSCDAHLHVPANGSSSPIIDIGLDRLAETEKEYPGFGLAMKQAVTCVLEPGDILFIPSLWFHNITSLDFSVSVNTFWRHLSAEHYDAKDLYGNRDPVHAATGLQAAKKARSHLSKLPAHYSRFYANRMARAVGPDE